ncbi:MAG TPA: helix-turn-helix transcriptional regulator [Thermoanaerobaculia bacterium]|nr:helix-turn-helix transcriptional regulator [Thermoanaerobaculia bacterium]
MRRNETPDERGICLYILRSLRGWTREELARALGVTAGVVSEYEKGKRYVPERIVRHAATLVGIPTRKLAGLEASLRDLRSLTRSATPPKADLQDRTAEKLHLGFEDLARRAVETVLASSRAWKSSGNPTRDLVPADVLWAELERCGKEERRLVVEEGVEYQTWGLCKLLCEKSLEAADAGAALELAELALHVAERVPGEGDRRAGVRAFSWAHLGHARRRLGDRSGAQEALARFRQLWHPDASSRTPFLDGARTADLEALVSGEIGSPH